MKRSGPIRRSSVLLVLGSLVALVAVNSPTLAEELGSIFQQVQDLTAAGNFPKALQQISLAQKQVESLHYEKLKAFFPTTLAGLKGSAAEANGALGFSAVERSYTSDDGKKSLKLSLTGGTGGPLPGLGNLAAFGQMAAALGAEEPGAGTMQVDGKTATVETKPKEQQATLTLFLEAGSILTIDMSGGSDVELLKKAVHELKIADLEQYLRG